MHTALTHTHTNKTKQLIRTHDGCGAHLANPEFPDLKGPAKNLGVLAAKPISTATCLQEMPRVLKLMRLSSTVLGRVGCCWRVCHKSERLQALCERVS